MSPVNKILSQALRLPSKERAVIVQRLISSLDTQGRAKDMKIERAWQKEIEKRWLDIQEGKLDLIPWEQVELELKKHARAED